MKGSSVSQSAPALHGADSHAEPSAQAVFSAAAKALTDEELVANVEKWVWFSAFANNNPRAPAHWKVDRLYDETQRREKPWLYQRGWNAAYRSCGYEPSAEEATRAQTPAGADTSSENDPLRDEDISSVARSGSSSPLRATKSDSAEGH